MTSEQSKKNVIRLGDGQITRRSYKKFVGDAIYDNKNEVDLDLSGINTMTTKELSEIIFYMKYATAKGIKLFLTRVSALLIQFFELTRTDNFFMIRST